jgi:hypothetical protein
MKQLMKRVGPNENKVTQRMLDRIMVEQGFTRDRDAEDRRARAVTGGTQ